MPRSSPNLQDTRPAFVAISDRPYGRLASGAIVAAAVLVIALWLLGTPEGIPGKADAIGYAICHQIPERSFHVHDTPLPLCARCTGTYLGVMVGLGILLAAGRGRASQLPPAAVLVILVLFFMLMGLDGVNSFLHLLPGYSGPYEPTNWLRLITGSLAGLTMITILLPVFSASTWAAPESKPVLRHVGELAGMLAIIGLVDALVLTREPLLLTFFGLLSAAGPVVILTLAWAVLFLNMTRREGTIRRPRDLILPLLAGLTLAFVMIGLIDFLRLQLTGTWAGFSLSQFGW